MLFDEKLILDSMLLTESAAIACESWVGRGNEKLADQAAVSAMRSKFEKLSIDGRIVIGEGERDDAPMLYIGEEVGDKQSQYKVDIAVDPLEGTTLCANAAPNSISVLALAPRGTLLYAPDVYMDKIAIGAGLPKDLVDLDEEPLANLKALAKAKKCDVSDLSACVLNRPRHQELIAKLRESGARVKLITDGDVTACIATVIAGCKVDIYMGIGGAPEGVLACAALKSLGGFFQGRLKFENDDQIKRAKSMGVIDPLAKLKIEDMVRGDVVFAATGVTDGWFLRGIKRTSLGIVTHSFVTSSFGGYQYIERYLNKESI